MAAAVLESVFKTGATTAGLHSIATVLAVVAAGLRVASTVARGRS